MARGSLIGNLAVLLSMDTSAFERGSTHAQRMMGRTQRQFEQLGSRITSAGQKLSLGMTLPLVAFGTASARAAIDAEELQSAFNVTFGNMAEVMNRWAVATGDRMGRSTQEIQRGANAFGLYFNQAARTREEAARMSQQFTVLAQDLASFHNTGVDEALLALRSGLSGESEPMRRFGVFLNEAAVQAEALALGLEPVNGRLSDQQKILARASLILKATADAQGDVLRTNESAANQIRRSQAAWEELTVTVGTKLIPALTPLMGHVGSLLNWFAQLPPVVQQVGIGAAFLGAAIGPLLIGFGAMVRTIGVALPLLVRLGPVLTIAGAAAGALGQALTVLQVALGPIGIAIAAIAVAWSQWDNIAGVIDGVAKKMRELEQGTYRTRTIGETFSSVDAFEAAFWDQVHLKLAEVTMGIQRLGRWMVEGVAAAQRFHSGLISLAVQGGTAIGRMVAHIGTWIGTRLNAVWQSAVEKIDWVKSAFRNLYIAVVGNSYVPDMVRGIGLHMARLDQMMVDPARRAAQGTAEAFRDMQKEVSDLLDRLFPEQRRAIQMQQDLARIASSGLSADQQTEARRRLFLQNGALDNVVPIGPMAQALPGLADAGVESFERIRSSVGELGQDINQVLENGLRGLMRGFGSLKDVALEVLFAIGDAMISQLFTNVAGPSKAGGIGGIIAGALGDIFRANGGPVVGGRSYIVGEMGPELFRPTGSGSIIPNHHLAGAGGRIDLYLHPTPEFDIRAGRVAQGVVVHYAGPIADEGAARAVRAMRRPTL